jgi:hypothetical protein
MLAPRFLVTDPDAARAALHVLSVGADKEFLEVS